MKKKYTLLFLLLFFSCFCSQGQVVNGNFEIVKPNFLPSNWGMNFSQAVSFDPVTGQSTSDNILFTSPIPSMIYATTDAHTGQYAMEISNAYNETQGEVLPGSATIFSDATQDSPGWNPGVPVNPGATIQRLGFYYKFLPLGNDVAEAKISVVDANGNEIGETHIDITGTNNQFQYIYSYVYLDYNATPAFMYISFNMAKEGSTPTFGSRLIVDNVVTNFQSLSTIENPNNDLFSVYPTLVANEINIFSSNQRDRKINCKIIDSQGKIIKDNVVEKTANYIFTMNTSDLNSGIYVLQIESDSEKSIKKFIKK